MHLQWLVEVQLVSQADPSRSKGSSSFGCIKRISPLRAEVSRYGLERERERERGSEWDLGFQAFDIHVFVFVFRLVDLRAFDIFIF